MKQDSLQQLLAKYQEGTINSEELQLLNRLTHRDEVLAAAEGRARTIVRRRTMRAVGLVVTAATLLGAGVWMLAPKDPGDKVLVASSQVESGERRVESGERRAESGERRVESGERRVESGERRAESGERRAESGERRVESGERRVESGEWKVESDVAAPVKAETVRQERLIADAGNREENTQLHIDATPNSELRAPNSSEPVVVCNNQCEADSVISDIWKFLSA